MLRRTIIAGLGLLGLIAPAAALPLARPAAPPEPLVTVSGGCGPYGHRGPFGGCRPGGQWGGYVGRACPPGFHLGPYGQRCWRNVGYGPRIYRPYAYGYRRLGWYGPRWHRWGGFRRVGWHGGFHRGWHRR